MTPARGRSGEGMIVGLIGFATVALFYAVFDLLAARGGLYTVNLLGMSVFRGLRDPSVLELPVRLDAGAIVLYSLVHLALALVIGWFVVRLVRTAERQPSRAALVTTIILAGFVITVLLVGWLSRPIRPVLPWWSIMTANLLSMVLAGWYLVRHHPGLWQLLSGGRPGGRTQAAPTATAG